MRLRAAPCLMPDSGGLTPGIKTVVISLHCHISSRVTTVPEAYCLESQKQMFVLQLLIRNDVISSHSAVVLRKSANILSSA